MPTSVNSAIEELADAVGDPFLVKMNRDHAINFINRSARDLRNSGWLLPIEPALFGLEDSVYEYDVPSNFAYVWHLREGSHTQDNAATQDTGTDIDGAIDASVTSVTVDDGSIFVVNDHIQLEDEILLITAISSNTLTVRRAQFGTTAASHSDNTDIDRPMTDVDFDKVTPRAYWDMKQATGGWTSAQAARGSRAIFVFDEDYFSFTADTPIQVVGQKRPTESYSSGDNLDTLVESFLLDRATMYASQFLRAQGDSPHLTEIAREAWGRSEQFLRYQPQEFRVRPGSKRVPGR